jgi:hypothetical protein
MATLINEVSEPFRLQFDYFIHRPRSVLYLDELPVISAAACRSLIDSRVGRDIRGSSFGFPLIFLGHQFVLNRP